MTAWLLLLLKTLHILGVITWMAGLLYLLRLYVYHRAETEEVVMARFRVMERRLWLAITVPAAWIAVLAGMTLKLLLVAALLAVHFLAGRTRKRFFEPPFPLSEKAFRFLNEVPTLLMIGIVVLVVFQPELWKWPGC